ncbi:unnamed protein product [Prunus brigantina]
MGLEITYWVDECGLEDSCETQIREDEEAIMRSLKDQENLDQRINMELVVQEWHGTSALLPDLPNSNHS